MPHGIGAASDKLLTQEGAKVAIFDIADAFSVIKEIEKLGNEAIYIACDISSPNSVHQAFNQVIKQFGKLDGLFNNAAIPGTIKDTATVSEKEFMQVMDVNIKGTFLCTKEAIPHLRKNKGGAIVNTASIAAVCGGLR